MTPHRRLDHPAILAARPLNIFLLLWSLAAPLPNACAAAARAAVDPAYYSRQASWQESMLASLEALEAAPLKDDFVPFESEIFQGGQPAQEIDIAVDQAKEMFLFVSGTPDIKWGVADWAEARLISGDGKAVPLSKIKGTSILLGRHEWDLTLRSGLYQKMRLNGREFDTGLHVQANSVVRVPLDGAFTQFRAVIGIDDWAGTNGHVRFSVVSSRTAAQKRLWELVARDFSDGKSRREIAWEREDRLLEREATLQGWAKDYARASKRVPPLASEAIGLASRVPSKTDLAKIRQVYYRSRELDGARTHARDFNFDGLRLAIDDLSRDQQARYPAKFRGQLDALEKAVSGALSKLRNDHLEDFETVARLMMELEEFQREALLANPLLDFERLLLVQRKPMGDPRRSQWEDRGLAEYLGLPKQSSWANGTMPNVDKWENQITVLAPVRPNGELTTLFKPAERKLVTDLDLHWDADRLLFSMPDRRNHWQIYELPVTSNSPAAAPPRQLTPGDQPEVHCYDACYLPNGKIDFLSTAVLQGVPCNAGVIVGMMYQMEADGRNIRQICFEQDHDYNPSVLNDGRVIYLRWDYTDTPHVWNRILMTMNPDGTSQMAYYGGNSYWPNSTFFPRAIPGHSTKIAGIVTGHHEGRVGELIVFDPAKGTHETDGVVQRIPGYGKKVEPRIEDKLTEHSWPKFTHPWPLSEKYFLVACKPEPDSLWGIYLVDVFDNMVLVKEQEGFALLEPIPLRKTSPPPVIPERVQPERKDALVFLQDVYHGPGLKGIPRGTVKSLRVFTYHFGYQTLAGIDHRVGSDGPWEAKRVLGTVPVEPDGSAWFRIPAKTPISVQPLDAGGKALALMRSWMTAMPGENVSCVGCHDESREAPPLREGLALRRGPSEIQPWRGPVRGFSFAREVQPVLDKFCVGCHDGKPAPAGKSVPDLRGDQGGYVVYQAGKIDGQFVRAGKTDLLGKYAAVFEPSYAVLRQYVRVGGLESDLHLLAPQEFYADTSELIQMLQKGHHGVELDADGWDRLVTWIDLNAPCHGTWHEVTRLPGNQRERRVALRKLYGGLPEDGEETMDTAPVKVTPIIPAQPPQKEVAAIRLSDWPLKPEQAKARQAELKPTQRTVDLGNGISMEFAKIPAGAFLMGDAAGENDEQPLSLAQIEEPFWMGACEVSNEQFRQFDPGHDSRFEHRSSWIFSEEYLGWRLNHPRQPVVRVSWHEAMAFCQWLSEKTGETVTLPSEAQWEYACRAGSSSALFYGSVDADFSKFGNMGDINLRRLASEGWRPKAPDLVVRDSRFDDGALVTAEIGRYQPNAWGLHDMHGNAAEWTRSTYQPYPSRRVDTTDGRSNEARKVVRGGSWRDRPKNCRSAFRLSYSPYEKVYNVGFRVVIESHGKSIASSSR